MIGNTDNSSTAETLDTRLGSGRLHMISECEVDGLFGLCPICGRDPEIYHVGCDEYGVCVPHRVYWYIGSNLLSAWRYMTAAQFDANIQMLSTMTAVEPAEIDKPDSPVHPVLFTISAADLADSEISF